MKSNPRPSKRNHATHDGSATQPPLLATLVPDPSRYENAWTSILRRIIDASVLKRLDEILEEVRRRDAREPNPASPTYVRMKELPRLIGVARSTIHSWRNPKSPSYCPTFPEPYRLGSSANAPVVWLVADIVAWIESRNDLPAASINANGLALSPTRAISANAKRT